MQRVGVFRAVAEDGTPHLVRICLPLPTDPAGGMTGQPILLTSADRRVFRVSRGLYQFVATGQRLRSTDPNAP